MVQHNRASLLLVPLVLLVTTGAASAVALPTSGYFVGSGLISAASADCTDKKGAPIFDEAALATASGKMTATVHTVAVDTTIEKPISYLTKLTQTGGTSLKQTGIFTLTVQNGPDAGKTVSGTVTSDFTPFDATTFEVVRTLTYTATAGKCVLIHDIVYTRSSTN